MRAVTIALLAALAASGARAQSQPAPDPGELLIPPELRRDRRPEPRPAQAQPEKRGTRPLPRIDRDGAGAPVKARPVPSARPVDFGVVVRGGSATPRVTSPIGSSQAVRESGSAVGAGMRFGF